MAITFMRASGMGMLLCIIGIHRWGRPKQIEGRMSRRCYRCGMVRNVSHGC